jgi:hypothetical protein
LDIGTRKTPVQGCVLGADGKDFLSAQRDLRDGARNLGPCVLESEANGAQVKLIISAAILAGNLAEQIGFPDSSEELSDCRVVGSCRFNTESPGICPIG